MLKRIKSYYKTIKAVKKETGWGIFETVSNVNYARDLGYSHREYLRKKLYKKSRDTLKRLADRREKDFLRIQKEMRGVSLQDVKRAVTHAEKRGISRKLYIALEMWNASPDEVNELGELMKMYREKQKREILWEIKVIQEKTGCSEEEAKARLIASRKMRYNFGLFIYLAKYVLTPEEIMGERKRRRDKLKPFLIENSSENNEICNRIMKEMNWSLTRLRLNYIRAHIVSGANFHNY